MQIDIAFSISFSFMWIVNEDIFRPEETVSRPSEHSEILDCLSNHMQLL